MIKFLGLVVFVFGLLSAITLVVSKETNMSNGVLIGKNIGQGEFVLVLAPTSTQIGKELICKDIESRKWLGRVNHYPQAVDGNQTSSPRQRYVCLFDFCLDTIRDKWLGPVTSYPPKVAYNPQRRYFCLYD